MESIKVHLGRKKEVPPQQIVLKIDGDKLNGGDTIEDLGLEDDDMLDAQIAK